MGFEQLFDRFVKWSEPDDRKLYVTSVLYSLFHLGLMWYAYLRLDHAPPYAFMIVHMVFVGVLYALPKEIVRWHNGSRPGSAKAGHLLVLLWFFSFLLMGLGQFCIDEKDYHLQEGMTEMTCFLLITLGVTHTSKKKHALKHPPCPQQEEDPAPVAPETEKPPA
ncbi:MAG TPA: hypothetical protein VL283_04540 [Candidatus Baltobacteraceae bacterium]|nr:hypothetical protein [Candidatus Baltobacteraceae bacterium]